MLTAIKEGEFCPMKNGLKISDARTLLIDLSETELFNSSGGQDPTAVKSRGLCSRNKLHHGKKYITLVHQKFAEHDIIEQCNRFRDIAAQDQVN